MDEKQTSKRFKLIDTVTGQIVDEADNKYPEMMTDEGYRIPSHKAGARIFEGVKFPSEMNMADIGRMTVLSKCMIGSTNALGYRDGRHIFAYTANEIGDIAGLSGTRSRAFCLKMCRLHVMQRINLNAAPTYYINPAYFMAAGHRLSLDLFLLFRDDLQDLIPKTVMADFLRQARDKKAGNAIL